jgi:WD40 repeat protein
MSAAASPDLLLEQRGVQRALEAYVVAAAFDRDGTTAAFGLGDGSVWRADRTQWRQIAAHKGGVLAVAPDVLPGGFVTGGDDGAFRRIAADGAVADIARFPRKWVEQVASHADPKAAVLACGVGKQVHVFDGAGAAVKVLDHPSTVTGLTFDAKGKRIGASHYNGATLWFVAAKTDSPRRLEWKGSHTAIAISPDGGAVVTAMQENALHGWRLADGQHMRMSGYPSKIGFLSFTRSGKWLATSGAEGIVLWPFFGGGPMGKQPTELAGGDGVLCSAVACHPQMDACAAGFSDGLVVLADIGTQRILPVMGPGRGVVTAMAWNADGGLLAFGTDTGFAAVIDFSPR